MENNLLLVGIILVGLLVVSGAFKPAAHEKQIVFVPVEVAGTPAGSWGCFSLILVGLLILLALGASW
jgi:hypothetical protein